MREIRPSSLEGGVRLIPHPYPYQKNVRCALKVITPCAPRWEWRLHKAIECENHWAFETFCKPK